MIDSQRMVERFMVRHGLRHDAATHTLDLVSEVGELAKLLLEASDYGRAPVDREADFADELGDVFYSLLALASVLEVDAGDALHGALRKYEGRLRERGRPSSS